jgi:hypothetical protein
MEEPRAGVSRPVGDGLEEALELARALAARIAGARDPGEQGASLRLAHALTLNVLDLLEDVRGR